MNKLKMFLAMAIILLFAAAFTYNPVPPSASAFSMEALRLQSSIKEAAELPLEAPELEIEIEADHILAEKSYYHNKRFEYYDVLYDMKALKVTLKGFDPYELLKGTDFYKGETKDETLNLRNALIRFQSSINEPVSGDVTTLNRYIMAYSKAGIYIQPKDDVLTPADEDKWITINKTTRILTLYEGNKVLGKYPVAIGKNPDYTPEGKFTIVIMAKNPTWGGGGYAKAVKGGSPHNPLGYRWMGLSIGGGGRYGIHGTNAPYSIGTNASHGCIRMINRDVEDIFDITPINTKVWIGTAEKLIEWGITQEICDI